MPIGWGVLRRQEWARRSASSLSLLIFFVVVALAPPLLLARELFTGQVVAISLAAGILLLVSGASFSLLSNPATRLHFQGAWEQNNSNA